MFLQQSLLGLDLRCLSLMDHSSGGTPKLLRELSGTGRKMKMNKVIITYKEGPVWWGMGSNAPLMCSLHLLPPYPTSQTSHELSELLP